MLCNKTMIESINQSPSACQVFSDINESFGNWEF